MILCWLLGTSVRKTSRFLRTDMPRSQHRELFSQHSISMTQNDLVLATWYICSEKATVRARERPFTRCRSTCNQVKCEDVDRCSFGSEKINTSSSRRSLC